MKDLAVSCAAAVTCLLFCAGIGLALAFYVPSVPNSITATIAIVALGLAVGGTIRSRAVMILALVAGIVLACASVDISSPGAMAHVLWWIGTILEWTHIPAALTIFVFGTLWMSERMHKIVVGLIVTTQAITLGCPLMPIIVALKQPHEPNYTAAWSLTAYLYHAYGPLFAVPIFLASVGLAWWVSNAMWIPRLMNRACSVH